MAVMLTVIASLFVAITIIPFLSSLLLRNEERPEGNFFMRLFKRWVNQPYQKVLGWSFRHPVISLLGATVIFVLSLLLVPRIGFSLFPLSEKPMFLVNIETPLGTNLDETNRITRDIEKNLESEPEIISLTTNVGKGNPRVYYNEFQRENSPNYAQILVQVEPEMLVPEITGRKVVLFSEEGRVRAETFNEGQALFAVRSYPSGDGTVRVELVPEIKHGEVKHQWVPGNGTLRHDVGRQTSAFDPLRVSAVLSPGQTLLVTSSDEPKGIGSLLFVRGTGDTSERLILLIRLAQTQYDDLFAPEQTAAPLATPLD